MPLQVAANHSFRPTVVWTTVAVGPRRPDRHDFVEARLVALAAVAFLLADREAKPPRLDSRLIDEGYAEEKLVDVVAGRLAIVKTIAGSRTARDVRQKIEKTARHFQWLRLWEHEA